MVIQKLVKFQVYFPLNRVRVLLGFKNLDRSTFGLLDSILNFISHRVFIPKSLANDTNGTPLEHSKEQVLFPKQCVIPHMPPTIITYHNRISKLMLHSINFLILSLCFFRKSLELGDFYVLWKFL